MPKRKNSKAAEQYTGRLEVKRMVQQQQWRKQHIDAHYCACIFRYLRECALLLRDFCVFACVDDKHRVKVGEPSCPVAAAERGRQVLVRSGTSFQVADHDFTRFSIIPSVALLVDMPDTISGSWNEGNVHVLVRTVLLNLHHPFVMPLSLQLCLNKKDVPHCFFTLMVVPTTDLHTWVWKSPSLLSSWNWTLTIFVRPALLLTTPSENQVNESCLCSIKGYSRSVLPIVQWRKTWNMPCSCSPYCTWLNFLLLYTVYASLAQTWWCE